MKATNESFSNVIGTFQYQIPYFQRSYVWKQEQLTKFAEDMLYVSEEYGKNISGTSFEYFMGTIIAKSLATNGYTKMELVDGQQRITTFTIFFKVLSLVYNDSSIFDNAFKFQHGFPQKQSILKLRSSVVDQPIMDLILNNSIDAYLDKNGVALPENKKWSKRSMHPLLVAYNYFREYVIDLRLQNKYINPDNIIGGVKFINMTLFPNDDEQVYFDNINSLGVRLTTSAIIKNYIFTHNKNGYDKYKEKWEPTFELDSDTRTNIKYWNGDGGKANIDEFLFCYLQAKAYDPTVHVNSADKAAYSRRDAVANHIKDLCSKYLNDDKDALLNEIIKYADTYSKVAIDNIGSITSLDRNTSICDMLARLGYLMKKLKVSTLMPYLLYLVNTNEQYPEETLGILKYLESYLIRRNLTDLSAANYNKYFREVLIAKGIRTLSALKEELAMANNQIRSTDMPSDVYIIEKLEELNYEGDNETPKALLYMYELSLRENRANQQSFGTPDFYTLEHLMPQNNSRWKEDETLNIDDDHIYKFGNMCLITKGLNSKIQNSPWKQKLEDGFKDYCTDTQTMKNVIDKEVWDNNSIDERTKSLVEGIISIWKA